MKLFQDLSDEYLMAIKWLKQNNLTNISIMSKLEKIIFFNLWFISFYIFGNNNDIHTINNFIKFVNDIDAIIRLNDNCIYNSIYSNYCCWRFSKNDYQFCLNLLRKSKYNNTYFLIADNHLSDIKFLDTTYNLDDKIKKHLIKIL